MAIRIWRGDAVAAAHVVRITPSTAISGRTYTLAINGKRIEVAGSGSVSALCEAFEDAIAESDIPEWQEVTAAASGGTLVLTGNTDGLPFKVQALVDDFASNEVQRIIIAHGPGGTWTVTFLGQTATGLSATISAADLKTALEALSTIGAGNLVVTNPQTGVYDVEFVGVFAGQDVSTMIVNGSGLTGGNAELQITVEQEAVVGTSSEQVVTLYGSPSGGSAQWAFDGYTCDVPYNADGAAAQALFEALPSVGSGNAAISGSAGGPWTVTFQNDLAHVAVPTISVDASGLTGGSIYATLTTTTPGVAGRNETQYLALTSYCQNELIAVGKTGTVSGGTWRWKWGTGGSAVYSDTMAYNVTESAALEVLDTFLATTVSATQGFGYGNVQPQQTYNGRNNVTISGGASFAYQAWGHLGAANVIGISPGTLFAEKLTIDSASLTGGGTYDTSFGTPGIDGQADVNFPSTAQYKLTFGSLKSAYIAIGASEATFQAALDSICGAGNTRATAYTANGSAANAWGLFKVEFIGNLAGTNVALLVPSDYTSGITSANLHIDVIQRWQGVPGTNEVQTLTIAGSPTTGTLTLARGTETTGPIAYNATANDVDTSLETLIVFGYGDVTCAGGALPGTPVTITYTGQQSYTDVPQLGMNDNGLKVSVVETTPGVTGYNEVVRLSLAGQDVWAGTLTLTYNAHTTGALNWNSTASAVGTELLGLADFDTGDIIATGGPWPETDILIEFADDVAETDVGAITATESLKNGTVTVEAFDPLIVQTTVQATGPNHWNDPVNWTGGAVPGPADTPVLSEGRIDILYGLRQVSTCTAVASGDLIADVDADLVDGQAVEVWTTDTLPGGLSASTTYYVINANGDRGQLQLAATAGGDPINITDAGTGTHYIGVRVDRLLQMSRYTGLVGLPRWSDGDYWEYRPLSLVIGLKPGGSKSIVIGQGEGSGSGRIRVDTGLDQVTLEVITTGGSRETGVPPLNWLGTHASNVVRILGGEAGVAVFEGQSATGSLIEVRSGSLTLGDVDFVALDKTGGQLITVDAMTLSGTIRIRA